jgi:hypoxanthine phosphoribosyltransferase
MLDNGRCSNADNPVVRTLLSKHIGRILLSEDAILKRVRELGWEISNDYRGKEITIVCVLKGAVVFLADLLRNLDVPSSLNFVQISSYGNGADSTGEAKLLQGLNANIEGQHVLVVDDIVDSGLTLHHLREILLADQPASLKLCVLLDKAKRRMENVKADYVGFEIPDEFVIGYGLDYAGHYRGLRYIAELVV